MDNLDDDIEWIVGEGSDEEGFSVQVTNSVDEFVPVEFEGASAPPPLPNTAAAAATPPVKATGKESKGKKRKKQKDTRKEARRAEHKKRVKRKRAEEHKAMQVDKVVLLQSAEGQAEFFTTAYRHVAKEASKSKGAESALALDFFDSAPLAAAHFSCPPKLVDVAVGGGGQAFADVIRGLVPQWRKKLMKGVRPGEPTGAPLVLVVCSSALRCCDVLRELHVFSTSTVRVGRLFAKHNKMPDQAKILGKVTMRVAVGTPARLRDLCQVGALNLSRLAFLMVDMWTNVKGYDIFEQRDISEHLFEFYTAHVDERIRTGNTKVVLW